MIWMKGTKRRIRVDVEDQFSNIFRSLCRISVMVKRARSKERTKNVIFEEPHTYFAINIEGDILWWWWR